MCLSCGQRFYDMRREPVVCPSCDGPMERKEAAPPPEPLAATEDGAQTPAEDKEMAAIESEEADSDIEGEDENDMAEVIEGIEQPKKKDVGRINPYPLLCRTFAPIFSHRRGRTNFPGP